MIIKRLLDVVMSGIGLILILPLFLIVAILIKLDSRGPVFFVQTRIGKDFKPFRFFKFRSMVDGAPALGPAVTSGEDPRITRVGAVLRMTKIDELPQLYNVLRGDISIVGPRPEDPKYVEQFHDDYREILTVKPGITDCASLAYRHEETLLRKYANPEQGYVSEVLPHKIELSKWYIRHQSFRLDLFIIFKTLISIVFSRK